MFRKLRNAAAILCGSALVSVAVLSSCQSAAKFDSILRPTELLFSGWN